MFAVSPPLRIAIGQRPSVIDLIETRTLLGSSTSEDESAGFHMTMHFEGTGHFLGRVLSPVPHQLTSDDQQEHVLQAEIIGGGEVQHGLDEE